MRRGIVASATGDFVSNRAVGEMLGVSRNMVDGCCKKFHESPDSGWARAKVEEIIRRKDMFGFGPELELVTEWLHTNEVSSVDNQRSKPIQIKTTQFDDNGKRLFLEHQRRELRFSDKILWQKLQQSNVWLQAQRIWQ